MACLHGMGGMRGSLPVHDGSCDDNVSLVTLNSMPCNFSPVIFQLSAAPSNPQFTSLLSNLFNHLVTSLCDCFHSVTLLSTLVTKNRQTTLSGQEDRHRFLNLHPRYTHLLLWSVILFMSLENRGLIRSDYSWYDKVIMRNLQTDLYVLLRLFPYHFSSPLKIEILQNVTSDPNH